jgi:teichoic acid transport system permease protein
MVRQRLSDDRRNPARRTTRLVSTVSIASGPMSTTGVVPELAELEDINASARIGQYIAGLWRRREYIAYVSASELRSQQIHTVLGNLWHLLNPALSIAIYYVIFGLLLDTTKGVENFILFLTVGIFVFQFTQRTTTQGATSITQNVGLLKAIRFPRALLPVTSTLTETMSSLPTYVLIYVMALFTGEAIRWQWALVPVVMAFQLLFNLGAAMIAARATTHFRDMTQLLPFFFRLLLYASGVIFLASAYAQSQYSWLFTGNPMYCYISITRWCVMGGDLGASILVSALVWTAALLVGGFLWFRAGEERYGRD